MFGRSGIREGMVVRSSDGEKLGKVFAVGDDAFHIEKGLFFPKDYLCRYSDISDIRGDEIILASGRDALRDLGREDKYATTTGTTAGLGGGAGVGPGALDARDTYATGGRTTTTGAGLSASGTAGYDTERRLETDREVAVPVAHEELDVVKREAAAGEVRIKKDVITEEKEVDVPVRRERVRVERRPVSGDRPAMSASFNEETVVVPVRAEEVDVRKRAVVDEEVVVRKDAVEEERRVAETLRREEVDVRTEGEVDRSSDTSRAGYGAPSDDPTRRY